MKTVWIVLNAGVGAELIGIFEKRELVPAEYEKYAIREIALNKIVNETICY